MAGAKVREAARNKKGSRRSRQRRRGGAIGANNERTEEGRGEGTGGQGKVDNERGAKAYDQSRRVVIFQSLLFD